MMKKKIKLMLNKFKRLSRQIGRSSSYNNSRFKSSIEEYEEEEWELETVLVGSTKRQYSISSKLLNHPLLNALVEKEKLIPNGDALMVKCEVVLFDHLLWMLDNAEPGQLTTDSVPELAEFYVM